MIWLIVKTTYACNLEIEVTFINLCNNVDIVKFKSDKLNDDWIIHEMT